MSFGNPSGLWLLLFAVPIVLAHLLRAKRARVVVSSTWLWQRATEEVMARHPFRRLRWARSLILQLLLLLTLALAASEPLARGQELLADQTALVFDVSASMQAHSGQGPSRLEEARAWAEDFVRRSGPEREVMILTAGSSVTVASVFERDRGRLLRTIEGISAEDAEGSLGPALELASARLAGAAGKRRIVVLTDGALADRSALFTPGIEIELVRVGSPVENVGIIHTDSRSERHQGREGYEAKVFARVKNHGSRPQTRFLTLRQRNVKEPLASRKLSLAPDEEVPVVLSFDAAATDQGAGLILELDPSDGLATDDRAYAIVPESRLLEVVLLEAKPAPWFARALLADPEVEVWTARSEAEMNAAGARGAFLVYSGRCPEGLPGGPFLVIHPPQGPCLSSRILPVVDAPTITSWRETDPRLRFLHLGDIHVEAANPVATSSEREALVRTNRGVIVSHLDLQGRQGTVVAFDVGASDWPLKASFVLFVRNLVEQAREHRLGTRALALRGGQATMLRVPLSATKVELSYARGDFEQGAAPEPVELDARQGQLALPPLVRAGFHQASWRGPEAGTTLLAASLASERESDLRERPLPEIGVLGSTGEAKASSAIVDWSWLLALLALLVVVVEVVLATRNPLRARTEP